MIGHSNEKNIKIENTGTSVLVIHSITIEGDDRDVFAQSGSCNSLDGGETCSVQIMFLPRKLGEVSARLVINSNDKDNPELFILLVGGGVFMLNTISWGDIDLNF